MALWEAGGETSPVYTTSPFQHDFPYFPGGKRRVSHSDGSDFVPKRPKFGSASVTVGGAGPSRVLTPSPIVPAQVTPTRELAFFVRPYNISHSKAVPMGDEYDREFNTPGSDPMIITAAVPVVEINKAPVTGSGIEYRLDTGSLSPGPCLPSGGGCSMERTASGLSISPGPTCTAASSDPEDASLLEDLEAAQHVENYISNFTRRSRNTRHERILRTLINPKNVAEFPIDNAALESIFSAANEIFFNSRLSQRVTWDWSHESASQYQSQVIGTTAFRRSKLGGYETLIVLSKPILKSANFSRRLLISTFLHEIIHSYLFIVCGLKARREGGHTEGFRQIATMIDKWAGPEHLRLQEMEADLGSYLTDQSKPATTQVVLQRPVMEQTFQHQPAQQPSQWGGHFPDEMHGDTRTTRYSSDSGSPKCEVLRLQPHRLPQPQREYAQSLSLPQPHQPQQPQQQLYHHVLHHHHHHHHHHYHYPPNGYYSHCQVGEESLLTDRRDSLWDNWIDDKLMAAV